MKSTPTPNKYSASSRSFTVSAEQSICSSGTLMPLRDLRAPPMTTSHVASLSDLTLSTLISRLPSSRSSFIPTVRPRMSAVCSVVGERQMRPGRVRSSSSTLRPSSTCSPTASGTGSSLSVVVQRNLGPWMSPRIRTSRCAALASSRMNGTRSSNCPFCRCEELRRKILTPALMSAEIISRDDDAGPRVATILALRARKSTSLVE
mmetsp:Transcript_23984/g.50332  ORF Transcript_23984/g.50332 Transcript_23984/m.50332 type:complete len:205 (-) Transcript_23984:88-702(-)